MSHEDFHRGEVVKADTERRFGQVFAVMFAIIGGLMVWRQNAHWLFAFVASAVFLALALWAPNVLYWPNRLWLALGLLLNKIMQPIVLAVVFYLVVTPIGLMMRLTGKDPLRLKLDKDAKSYWLERDHPPGSMSKQF